MFLGVEQGSVSLLSIAEEPLTVVAGRGDRRTKRGKRFFKSFGKVCPAPMCSTAFTALVPKPLKLY